MLIYFLFISLYVHLLLFWFLQLKLLYHSIFQLKLLYNSISQFLYLSTLSLLLIFLCESSMHKTFLDPSFFMLSFLITLSPVEFLNESNSIMPFFFQFVRSMFRSLIILFLRIERHLGSALKDFFNLPSSLFSFIFVFSNKHYNFYYK